MLPYYLLIVPIAAMASVSTASRPDKVAWAMAFSTILIFVGLRHHVGMDWNNYLIMIQHVNIKGFWDAINVPEPSYALLLWVSGRMQLGIYGAYFVGTLIFAAGLFKYAKTTPAPWMALLVAIPFPVIVISMAAARQTVAMGVMLWLVADWDKSSVTKRIALILFASTFHTSALVFLVFVFLDIKYHWAIKVLGSIIVGAVAIYYFESTGRADYYDSVYGSGQSSATHSSGAIFHVLLNGGPALVAFFSTSRIRAKLFPNVLHRNMAIAAVLLIPLSFVTSAASGRLTLYLFPVSMWFFATLPGLFANADRPLIRGLLASCFVGLLAFWLNFGNSATAHKNYQNALLAPPHEVWLCCRFR